MRFAWVGAHAGGIPALEGLLAVAAPIAGVLTLRPDLAAKRSAAADYGPLCRRYGVPLHCIANVNDPQALRLLSDLAPDVVFVIGWPQIVRPAALRLARLGMIGAHASLLPRLRGSAPINWALIRSERETGSTLLWLAEDVNAGDIIDQAAIPITPYDTCASLSDKVAAANREMLLRLMPRLLAGQRPGRPQALAVEPMLPRRRAADGLIDWTRDARTLYDFVRALTRPYPGAFSFLDGRRWVIWQAALAPLPAAATPGQVVGAVLSPVAGACGQLVACGAGGLVLLELEAEDGTTLAGPALSDQSWVGKRWGQG